MKWLAAAVCPAARRPPAHDNSLSLTAGCTGFSGRSGGTGLRHGGEEGGQTPEEEKAQGKAAAGRCCCGQQKRSGEIPNVPPPPLPSPFGLKLCRIASTFAAKSPRQGRGSPVGVAARPSVQRYAEPCGILPARTKQEVHEDAGYTVPLPARHRITHVRILPLFDKLATPFAS